MPEKLRKYALVGLTTLIASCVTKEQIDNEVDRTLKIPNREFTSNKVILPEELPSYLRGPTYEETTNGFLVRYPVKNRDVFKLIETTKPLFPEYILIPDLSTNQLLARVPYNGTDTQPTDKDKKVKEFLSFLDETDIHVPQYDIRAYVMQVNASHLNAVRSSLDVLIESGDVNLALNSLNLNDRQEERGIEHIVTGIFDLLPTFQITALFNGLERRGYVYNLSHTQIATDDGEPAQVGGKRKVPIPKIFPTAPVPIIGYEYTDVDQLLKVTPRSRADRSADLDIEITKGNVVPTGRDLHDIFSRTTKTRVRVPLGNMLILATTLEDSEAGVNERSPLGEVFGSTGREERSRVYELAAIVVNRIDATKSEKSWPVDELQRQLNRDYKKD